MRRVKEILYSLHPFLLSSIAGVLTVAQIGLAFFVHRAGSEALEWAGWICIWTSAIFGWLPIFTFRRKGGVAKGDSYIKTTTLVDTGIYAIVRHPQGGTAWLLINLGVMLIAQHWSSVILGLTSMALAYADSFKTDQSCVEKFGDAYVDYMERVPRLNFLTGVVRLIQRRQKTQK
jgi:protein-S-isoprenylcysteine O-methyltransferase Ste14